jgi:hypothetical protein
MLACDWNGHSYSASTILEAVAKTAATSPRFTSSARFVTFAARTLV